MENEQLSADRSIVDSLKLLDVQLGRAMSHALRHDEVTASQAGVLLFLAQRRGVATSNRAIEEHFNISNPAVSAMVKRLEAKGFVSTSVDPTDRRCHCVSITDEGYAAMVSADRKVKALDDVIFDGFSPEDEARARELVTRMLANLQR
ncbi:MAG: MarR family transcriptional regulator [Coriobacteriia bacterium]|nr:MarR family transcriptional regulator [Coriobacteriia bacterium]